MIVYFKRFEPKPTFVEVKIAPLTTDRSAFPTGADFTYSLAVGFVWTLFAMAIGWGVASALGLAAADRFTFLIEFSARNIALAFIVAVSSLGRLDLGVFSGAYSMTGFPLVIAAAVVRGRRLRVSREAAETQPGASGAVGEGSSNPP